MKHHKLSQTQQTVMASEPVSTTVADPNGINFVPSPDEVARKAYFAYENERSEPGHDVQHWLKAEADLIAERNLTRIHGFHNRT
jgi:Protein of unknown function (DUF2934)